jgi:two-component system sensor histidine kinase KdpD
MQNKTVIISTGKQYFLSTVILFGFITILYFIQDLIGYQTVSLILLLIIFLLPLFNFERGPIILAAVISALAWDYYFIPPHFTLHIARPEDVMMLCMFIIVAMTNGVLTARLKEQKNDMTTKERRSNALYNLLKDLSAGKDLNEVSEKAVKQIQKTFGFQSVIFYSTDYNKLNRNPHPASSFLPDEMEWLAAELSYVNKSETGRTTGYLNDADAIYFPLKSNDSVFGVIGVNINDEIKSNVPEMGFLRRYVNEIIIFLERHSVQSIP